MSKTHKDRTSPSSSNSDDATSSLLHPHARVPTHMGLMLLHHNEQTLENEMVRAE